MQSPPDVIQNCLSGDEHAYSALFEQYKALVYRTAYLMLGSANDAEDTLQEVFTQVFRALHTYDAGRSAFSTWLHRITVNACLTHRRRMRQPARKFGASSANRGEVKECPSNDDREKNRTY